MGAVNFYLKKAEAKTGKSLIYLKFKYNGTRVLVYTFGQTIHKKDWNPKKQRVKSNTQTTADGKYSLNDLLDNLEKVCEKAYHSELSKGVPEPATLKKHFVTFFNRNKKDPDTPTLYKLIDRFVNNEIKYKGITKADGTIAKYKTCLAHLKEFQEKSKYKIDFDTITLDFFYKYVTFLKSKSLAQNTIAKDIKAIKTFMNEALDLGHTTNLQHKHKKFAATWEAVDAVYLKENEILELFKYDLSVHKKYEQVRDLFVFGCYTGLRFSDYSGVKPENIISIDGEPFIKLITVKTGEQVIIPCSPVVQQIFDKYKASPNRLPRAISNQKFNEYIKKACEKAGLKETGRLISDPVKPLYECISSHTARRSFATNLYLEGYPTIEIMKITGHRTEKSFLTYIKVSKLDAAKRLSKHMQLRWSEKLLKAV